MNNPEAAAKAEAEAGDAPPPLEDATGGAAGDPDQAAMMQMLSQVRRRFKINI